MTSHFRGKKSGRRHPNFGFRSVLAESDRIVRLLVVASFNSSMGNISVATDGQKKLQVNSQSCSNACSGVAESGIFSGVWHQHSAHLIVPTKWSPVQWTPPVQWSPDEHHQYSGHQMDTSTPVQWAPNERRTAVQWAPNGEQSIGQQWTLVSPAFLFLMVDTRWNPSYNSRSAMWLSATGTSASILINNCREEWNYRLTNMQCCSSTTCAHC